MKISLEWLSDILEISATTDELIQGLTLGGIEVEGVEQKGANFKHVVVAEILSSAKHPSADRLSVCQVNIGTETKQIVCGAKNYKVGDRVPLALPGAVLPGDFKIKESKLRGELSQGMMCSSKELGLSGESEGLLILDAVAPLGQPIAELFPPDTVFDLEITPNRPDLLSHHGLAREMVALGLAKWKKTEASPALPSLAQPPFPVVVENALGCPCYTATVIEGLQVGQSPAWMRRRLEAVGLRAINSVVDITNYILLDYGQPMHAFDLGKLSLSSGLHIRCARAGEKIQALDHQAHSLLATDWCIADDSGPVALAGVIGGELSAVTQETTSILLEVARFNPPSISATSRRLGLSTDSSYRFERGTPPLLVLQARDRAVALLAQIAGGCATSASVTGDASVSKRDVTLRFERVKRLLGTEVPKEKIRSILLDLGVDFKSETESEVVLSIPEWRLDLEREVDIIEEISRVVGLEQVPSRLLFSPSPSSDTDRSQDRLWTLKQFLANNGFFEVVTNPLEDDEDAPIQLVNPMTVEQVSLRKSLKRNLLRVAAHNLHQGKRSLKLFEAGPVFDETGEKWCLGILLTGARSEAHWSESERETDIFEIKGLLETLGVNGSVELVAPSELREKGIKQPVCYAEIDLEPLCCSPKAPAQFKPWPVFPSILRDVAVVVSKDKPAGEVLDAINACKPEWAEEVVLFDVFADETGARLAADKKSLACRLRYRNRERTLTDKEVNGAHDSFKAVLKSRLGCEFRE